MPRFTIGQFIINLSLIVHGINSLTLPPPSLSVTRQGDNQLNFTVGPPLGATGITGYELHRQFLSNSIGSPTKAKITSGIEDPVRTNFKAANCFDGEYTATWSECCTNTNKVGVFYKFTVETPAFFDHVKITRSPGTEGYPSQPKYAQMINFDMKYKDEANAWHDCPETPYHYPEADGIGPKAFACNTPVKAKQIQLIQKGTTNMCMGEVEIYVNHQVYSIGPQNEYSLTQTGIGKSEANYYIATCNSDGCGNPSTTPLALKFPTAPSQLSVSVDDDNSLTFQVQAPVDTGTFELKGYKVVIQDSSVSTTPVCGDATLDIGTDGVKTLTGTGYGLESKKSFVWSFTDLGCSANFIQFVPGVPGAPSLSSLTIVDADTLLLVGRPPLVTGGKDVTKYKIVLDGPDGLVPRSEYTCSGSSTQNYKAKIYLCDGQYDSQAARTYGYANSWMQVAFAAKSIASVKIWPYESGGNEFKLEWLAEDGTYHVCPGPALHIFAADGSSEQYACSTGTEKAIAVRMTQPKAVSLWLFEAEIYIPSFTTEEFPVDNTVGAGSGSKTLVGTGFGTPPQTRQIHACNPYGCSVNPTVLETGVPSPPAQLIAGVSGIDTVTFEVEPPTSNGGKPITKFVATIIPLYGGLPHGDYIKDVIYEEIKSSNCGALPNKDYIKDVDTCIIATERIYGSGIWYKDNTRSEPSSAQGCYYHNDDDPNWQMTFFNSGQSSYADATEAYPQICVTCPDGTVYDATNNKCFGISVEFEYVVGKTGYSAYVPNVDNTSVSVEMQACNPFGCSPPAYATNAGPCSGDTVLLNGVCWSIVCDIGYYRDATSCEAMTNAICTNGTSYSSASASSADFRGSTLNDAVCTPCAVGKANPLKGTAACETCTNGRHTKDTGALTCIDCPIGYYGTGDGQCSACVIGQYNDRPRQVDCFVCKGGQYSDQTSRDVCKNCPGGYTLKDQGLAIDKHDDFEDCAMCEIGTFNPTEGSSQDCPVCAGGWYSDQTKSISCKNCPSGYSLKDEGSADKHDHLNDCKMCEIGTFNKNEGSNQDCGVCAGGQYSNQAAATACKNCPSGYKLIDAGQTIEQHDDIEDCKMCAVGKYNPVEGLDEDCSLCGTAATKGSTECDDGVCNEGSFQNTSGVCELCTKGRFTPLRGLEACYECPAGWYSKDERPYRDCQTCPRGKYGNTKSNVDEASGCLDCIAGRFSEIDGLNGLDLLPGIILACNGCPGGKYSTEIGQSKESLCKDCGTGRHGESSTGASVPTVCKECAAGQFSETVGASNIDTCGECPAGFSQKLIGRAYCLPCIPGTFSTSPGTEQCTECAIGHKRAPDDDATACIECASGRYQNSNGQASCLSCIPGTFSTSPGNAQCTECAVGYKRSPHDDVKACVACEAGFHQDDKGQTSCMPCVPGTFSSTSGNEKCADCAVNHFASEKEATNCTKCASGSHTDSKTASSMCFSCDAGKYGAECTKCAAGRYREGDDEESDSCRVCGAGKFQGVEGQSTCNKCSAGKFQNVAEQTECKNCPVGYKRSSDDDATQCIECVAGKFQGIEGQSTCDICSAGKFQNNAEQTRCENCPVGYKRSPDDDAKECVACAAGLYQDDAGQASCMPCVPGTFSKDSLSGIAKCTECDINYISENKEATKCTKCDMGSSTNGKNSSSTCFSCDAGKFGAECTKCAAGQYREGDDKVSSHCRQCEAGLYQSKLGQSTCFPCVPGKYTETKGESQCKDCAANTFSDVMEAQKCEECEKGSGEFSLEGATACVKCELGKHIVGKTCVACTDGQYNNVRGGECKVCEAGLYQSKLGQSTCFPCVPGKYTETKGESQCKDCAANTFSDVMEAQKCEECEKGTGEFSLEGATACVKCELGKHIVGETCVACTDGQYNNVRGNKCKACPSGEYPNEAKTSCVNPDWTIAGDCDYTTQYLDDSSTDKYDHKCKPCPTGASCEGDITWNGVVAKYGWWRIRVHNRTLPPSCLDPGENAKELDLKLALGCAFEQCPNPHACHGAKNPGKFLDSKREDPAEVDHNETCVWKKGYQIDTCGDDGKQRCRLCGTCREGWKRYGESTECKECPPTSTNRLLLVVGFVVMILGSGVLIYMTIKDEEAGEKETSDAVKKIIFNFLQMLSLAGGLPLQWTPEIESMFQTMATLSSAGTTLLIPDCELSYLRTSDVFFMKQIAFTFAVPVIVISVLFTWSLIRLLCRCKKCRKIKARDYKNYTILSCVLMLFLCYPTLVEVTLTMLKCVQVGPKRYLMASLEETCFEGRHATYVTLLTVPQLLLVVIGLPVLAGLTIIRNGEHFERYDFRMRYGLLYLGYREERAWWEIVIAFRKVAIVMISTFGVMVGVDLQAFLALFVIFCSIMIHLIGKPFDVSQASFLLLHQLECAALALCWFTFWGGLLFYLGQEKPGVISEPVTIIVSIIIVVANTTFLIFSTYKFFKEFVKDYKKKEAVRRKSLAMLQTSMLVGRLGASGMAFGGTKVGGTKVMPAPAPSLFKNSAQLVVEEAEGEDGPRPLARELVLGPTVKRDQIRAGSEWAM